MFWRIVYFYIERENVKICLLKFIYKNEKWKWYKCFLVKKWINKMWYGFIILYYIIYVIYVLDSIKKNKILVNLDRFKFSVILNLKKEL